MFCVIFEVSNQNNTDMKKKIFTALLSLAAVAGIAIAENETPILRTSPYGTVNVLVGDEFTFTIRFQYTQELVVTADNIENENCWIWWWDRGVAEPNEVHHTGSIHTQYTTRNYQIVAYNGNKQSSKTLTYRTERD
jgi:hypothetical protein